MKRHWMALACAMSLGLAAPFAHAQNAKVTIGLLTDMSGVISDLGGPGSLEAVRMAVADFGGKVLDKPVEVLFADHQNKADIAAARAREWIDRQNLDLLIGGTNSAAALAMNQIAAEKNRVFIVDASSDRFTNEDCKPFTIHYPQDTTALARGTATAMVKEGGNSWFFLTADYAFGHSLEKTTADVVRAQGGKVLGSVRHPIATTDFSSYMLQAQASRAQVLGLANAGADTVNAIKSARDFGLAEHTKLAALLVFISEIHSLGLQATQGLYFTETWYWDLNDRTREFGRRFHAKTGKMPTTIQTANYSAVTNWLKAVQAVGTTDAAQVVAYMKRTPIDDVFAKGRILANGSFIKDTYLMQVKKPSESKAPWDYYHVVARIPGEQAFRSEAESTCALLRKG